MGDIVAAAVVSHQPSVMMPEQIRKTFGGGQDTSLVPGFARLRAPCHSFHTSVRSPDSFCAAFNYRPHRWSSCE